MTPFIIAEIASCHEGQLARMLASIQVAIGAGANAWKTWWTSDPERTCARMHAPEMREAYRLGAWPRAWLPSLATACHAGGLEFLCTVDLPEDIAVVAPCVDRFKIASWGSGDGEFIFAHQRYQKPLVISTGASDGTDERPVLIDAVDDERWYLHCVSAYPAPLEECNLAVITIEACDGFSDHTRHVLTGSWAVCAGATVLEVHFRLDDTPESNPDFAVSLTPSELRDYVRLSRLAALAMGDGIKRCMPSEAANRRFRYV